MRLFAQTLTGISLVTLFSFGGAWAAREVIVKPHLLELAAAADRKDLRRALLAIDGKQQQLVALAYDRALTAPDDNANTPPVVETFIALNIDYIAIFDGANELLRWLQFDPQQSALVPTALDFNELKPYLNHTLPQRAGAPVFVSGWMLTSRGPLLYALASSPDRSVLFAADIDEEFVQDIKEITQLNLRLSALPAHATAKVAQLEQLHRDDNNEVFWVLNDALNRPVLQLTLTLPPRSIVDNLVSTPLIIAFLIALIGSLFMLGLVERALILPVRALGWHLRRVRQLGDYNLRLRLPNRNELGDLSQELNNLVEHVQTQQLQLIAQSRELQALSYQDSLTTLANRRRFDQALADNWAMAQRMRKSLALIMCDVDYFKAYNDHYGHQKGDEILRQLAQIISQVVVRTSDLATRYGGEEFAILLPDTTEEGAVHLAQQLQQKLQAANISHEYSHICRRLTISVGVAAIVPGSDQGPRDLVRLADEALYAAKAGGRNRIEMATGLL
ncbi:MAG: diguanylate cyclase [Spongiibacteraceae bacterium]